MDAGKDTKVTRSSKWDKPLPTWTPMEDLIEKAGDNAKLNSFWQVRIVVLYVCYVHLNLILWPISSVFIDYLAMPIRSLCFVDFN